ncbi:hypothetical protein PROVRETT_09388 [Providencia rettgeri DSM 1131]|nr:hypothetical protein PROVRETT_09388 [Providencia rettgeri DSM 1131]
MFAHILFAFRIFVDFLTVLSLKHQQQLLTIVHYHLVSKGRKRLKIFKIIIFYSMSQFYPLILRCFFHHSVSFFLPASKKTDKK